MPYLVETTSDFALNNNIYWTFASAPDWNMNGTDYTSLASYRSASGQDLHSMYTDPMLNTPTYHTVGRPVSAFTLLPGSPAIGADQRLQRHRRMFNGNAGFFGATLCPAEPAKTLARGSKSAYPNDAEKRF